MNKLIMMLACLSAAHMGCTQYVHWNYEYLEDPLQNSPYSVFLRDSVYYSLGYLTPGVAARTIDLQGNILQTATYQLSYPFFLSHFGNKNESVLEVGDDFIVINTPSNCGSDNFHFCMTKFNDELDTLWSKRYNWLVPSDCDSLRNIGMQGEAVINDSVFVAIALMRAGSWTTPDSNAVAYLHFDFEGNLLQYYEKQNSHLDEPPIQSADGLRYIGNNELLQWGIGRPLLPGKLYDYQEEVCVVKTDLEGNIIDSLHFGNPNYNEQGSALELLSDNKAILFYQYTIYESGFPQWLRETEPRAVLIELTDLSVIWHVTLDTDFFDDYFAARYRDALVTSDGKFVACFGTGTQSQNGQLAGILKVDANGELEWCNHYYYPGGENGGANLFSIVEAPDGGYVGTGQSGSNNQWLLKIDACGYEEPSGCPPVVGVAEQAKPTMQVWPNPFTTTLKANLPNNAQSMYLTDATGRVVFSEKVFYPKQEWDLSKLADGVYVMNVTLESGMTVSERIVKR